MAARKEKFEDGQQDKTGRYNTQAENAEKSKKRVRITIDVSPEMRHRIRKAAVENDVSVTDYILSSLEKTLPEEEKEPRRQPHPVTKEAIERLQKFREQLMKETNGHVFEDSAEILRQEREKRTQHLMDVFEGKVK